MSKKFGVERVYRFRVGIQRGIVPNTGFSTVAEGTSPVARGLYVTVL